MSVNRKNSWRYHDLREQLPAKIADRVDISIWVDRTVILIERTPERKTHWIKLDDCWRIPSDQLAQLCLVVQ
jgi:hypothetical protein